jgi:hypothetical protein
MSWTTDHSAVSRDGAPAVLGRYELISRIGEGGMAEAHLARMRGPIAGLAP